MTIDRLDTPALLLEESVFNRNRAAMTEILQDSTLKLRPHYKSHKCAAIAKMQIADGAVGMTCAKLSEAEDLADCGIEDILIANQITDPWKIRRGAQLAGDCRLTVCMDDPANIDAWEKAAGEAGTMVHCLVEYEIGMRRCGVTTAEEVLTLAARIAACPHLIFDGIQAYAGHISHMEAPAERARLTAENSGKLRLLLDRLTEAGLPVRTLSGGSTGTAQLKAAEGLYTELQAGSYLFLDATYRTLDLPFGNALTVLSTVVSAKPGLVVVDAGVKSCGVDQGMPRIYGDEAEEISACEEHFQIFEPTKQYKVGDKLMLIPAHCCSTVNLHDKIYMVNKGRVVSRIAVSARGCSK